VLYHPQPVRPVGAKGAHRKALLAGLFTYASAGANVTLILMKMYVFLRESDLRAVGQPANLTRQMKKPSLLSGRKT
jgi:hypothetical protein